MFNEYDFKQNCSFYLNLEEKMREICQGNYYITWLCHINRIPFNVTLKTKSDNCKLFK